MFELLSGFGALIIYFIVCASTAVVIKFIIKVPHEVFRKLLHLILLGSLFVFIFCFKTWWISALASVIFAMVVYPILAWAEKKFKGYSGLLEERKGGEIKASLLLVFTMFAVVMTICWGLCGDKILALASICAWGFGDAAAALIGKKFGRHPLEIKKLGVKKSWEGTSSMFTVSFISVFLSIYFHGGFTTVQSVIIAVITAAVTAYIELITKGGNDTVTCPLAAMSVILPLTYIFGGGF